MARQSVIRTQRPSQTKIVATVGPACDDVATLQRLIEVGCDVFRINTAHGDIPDFARRLEQIRDAAAKTGIPVGVLVDLGGPKIRLGELPEGQFLCVAGKTVRFVRGDRSTVPGEFTSTYAALLDELAPGDRVMMADGTVALRVEEVTPDAAVCRVVQGGIVRSRQGINLPGVKLKVDALQPKDREAARWAAQNDVDFVGLSFVRTPDEILRLRDLIAEAGGETQIIAKIEKPEALENLEAIVQTADGVMVARGDLGVEIDIARVAVEQKRIIREATKHRKPVIIATQMLDSMQHARLPTRAEVADVSNAILDGADACMLSGETAIGQYPVEAVEMMHRIAMAVEQSSSGSLRAAAEPHHELNAITESMALHAGKIAVDLGAKLIVVASSSGQTALSISKHRFPVPTVGVSSSPAGIRRMCLYWGVIPLPEAPADDPVKIVRTVVEWGRQGRFLEPGDRIVLITGTGLPVSAHNAIVVHQIS
ncbi:MAG: pyruvate kinase [Planctomycetota bacterium]|nr:MAG: pyruvate kinase [Planctomycetota bacterium]